MKKAGVFAVFLLSLFPISWLVIKKFLNFDNISAIVFLLLIIFLVTKNRKVLDFQAMLKLLHVPLIYAVLWRTKFGVRFMDKISSKYRELIKLLGYCFIGFGFLGLIMISLLMLKMLFDLFKAPVETSQGVALLLPLTNIPGLGYLSFWHFIITIFLVALVHEFAHGIVARAHGLPIKSSGLGVFSILIPLFPLAFVEPDEKKLVKQKDIVQYSIFAAGPVINIIMATIIFLFLSFVLTPIHSSLVTPIGFTYADVMDDYSAKEAGMKPGMIINEVNGESITDYQGFIDITGELKPGQELQIGTTNGTFSIIAKPSKEDPKKGFMGIIGISNEFEVKQRYKSISAVFFWIKDLFYWLFVINFLVGIINLLPLIVTDGGRMFKLALEKTLDDSKKADKVWLFIGFVFLFTLLSALAIRYGFPLFSWLVSIF